MPYTSTSTQYTIFGSLDSSETNSSTTTRKFSDSALVPRPADETDDRRTRPRSLTFQLPRLYTTISLRLQLEQTISNYKCKVSVSKITRIQLELRRGVHLSSYCLKILAHLPLLFFETRTSLQGPPITWTLSTRTSFNSQTKRKIVALLFYYDIHPSTNLFL